MICAVLHDLVEDCEDWSFNRLRNEGFSEKVIMVLSLLTHYKGIDYLDYIKSLSHSELATAIKLADLEHNSKISRLKGLRDKDFERMKKYSTSYNFLKSLS